MILSRWKQLLAAPLLVVLLACTSCCCMSGKFADIDVSQPGWHVQQGEALWRPKKGMPELAGEIVLASHTNGQSYIQFTKTTLPVVAGQLSDTTWQIQFPPRKLCFSGHGTPPARFGWLQVPRASNGSPLPTAYQLNKTASGGWKLENKKTGETIEWVLSP